MYHTSLLQVYRIKWSGKELLNKREGLPRGRIICCALLMSFPCQIISFEIIKNWTDVYSCDDLAVASWSVFIQSVPLAVRIVRLGLYNQFSWGMFSLRFFHLAKLRNELLIFFSARPREWRTEKVTMAQWINFCKSSLYELFNNFPLCVVVGVLCTIILSKRRKTTSIIWCEGNFVLISVFISGFFFSHRL